MKDKSKNRDENDDSYDRDEVAEPITDAVTATDVEVLGDASAMAMAFLFQATGQALAHGAHAATFAQQNAGALQQAATTQGVALQYGLGVAATATELAELVSNAS